MTFPQRYLDDANKKTIPELKSAIHSMRCSETSKDGNGKKRLDAYEHVLKERLNIHSYTEDHENDDNAVPLDFLVAKKYQQLHTSAIKRSKEWNLSLSDVKKLITRKTCAYTGIRLTKANDSNTQFTDLTIDRLDNTKGYVKGNVFAVSHGANQLKNLLFERNGGMGFDVKEVQKMLNVLVKLTGKD